MLVESEGLGWHSRSFSDEFDICGTPDGTFVTVFHTEREEPLEKIARTFFSRTWDRLGSGSFRCLAVSRYLAASIVSQVVQDAFQEFPLTHYPGGRLLRGMAPMFASGRDFCVGYRFFSEDAYAWARRNARSASRVVGVYFADTTHQFRTDLPSGTEVHSIAQLDANELGGEYEEFIRVILRGLQLPGSDLPPGERARVVLGLDQVPPMSVSEADVNEALAGLKRPCTSKEDLRYQLASAVVLNRWIEEERQLGFVHRKKFYAFKQQVGALAKWAADARMPGVRMWTEAESGAKATILFIRIDNVDFSFHAIPGAGAFRAKGSEVLTWSGVRLKPIAPIVLAWARALRSPT
jgi:hypothetical protein